MTTEEQAAADAAKAKADAEANKNQSKVYSEEEFKKLVAERDKAKEKLRARDEEDKKVADQKAIDEGRTKELLLQREQELLDVKKKNVVFEEQQAKLRQGLLDKITDPSLKALAEKLPEIADVQVFVDLHTKTPSKTYGDKSPGAKVEFADQVKGFKSIKELEKFAQEHGMA